MEVLFLLFLFSPSSQGTEVTPGYCPVNSQLGGGTAGRRAAQGEGGIPAAMEGCAVHQVPKEAVEGKLLLQSSASLARAKLGTH